MAVGYNIYFSVGWILTVCSVLAQLRLAQVLSQVLVVDSVLLEEVSVADLFLVVVRLLVAHVRQLATSVVDQTTLLAIARLKQ